MKRKIISVIMAMAMLFAHIPASANAQTVGDSVEASYEQGTVIASGTMSTGVTWSVDDLGNLIIGGNGAISGVEPWKDYKASITNIVIGDGITRINTSVFQNYTSVKTVTIGKNVTSFGQQSDALSGMSNLETVYWNATSVEDMLFGGEYFTAFLRFSGSNTGGVNIVFGEDVTNIPQCFTRANLKRVTIPSTVEQINWNFSPKEIEVTDLKTWLGFEFGQYNRPLQYANLYVNGELVTDVVIPDSVTVIPDYAFSGSTTIKSVVIPDTVEDMGDYTFYQCTGLEAVELAGGITAIGSNAFYGCTALTDVVLPDSVVAIGNSAFYGCTKLSSIQFSENVTQIDSDAFRSCNALSAVYYGGNVFDWDKISGNGKNDLKYKTIYYSYEDIVSGYGVCGDDLSWILAEDGTLTITGTGDMYDYPSRQGTPWGKEIMHVVIEEGVTSIGEGAFFDCYYLESAYIADSVKLIGYQAFCFCEELTDLYIGKGVTELGESAFSYCSSLTSVTIPASVRTMTHNAFSYCENLKTAIIEEGVPYIYNDAFNYCTALEEITIPVSVKSVGVAAFGYCTALKKVNYAGTKADWDSIDIEDGNKNLITAYESGLAYETDGKCGENLEWKLENGVLTVWGSGDMYDYDITDAGLPWYEMGDEVKKVVIENGVTSIGAYTFWMCFGLVDVVIPDTVTRIGNYAFGNCDKLADVYFLGSTQSWERIDFDRLNPYIKDAKLHCLDRELNFEKADNKIYVVSKKQVEDARIYVGLYDVNNKLLGTNYVPEDIALGINVIPSPIANYTGAVTVKIFAWGGESALLPLFDAGEFKN